MAHRQGYEGGDLSGYDNPELVRDLETLEDFRSQRAQIALATAKHIMESSGGVTTDLALYYVAMFGRSYSEGLSENDENLKVPRSIAQTLALHGSPGEPLLIRSTNLPQENAQVGVVGSFAEEVFRPVQFEIELEKEVEGFVAWRGSVAIAMRKVEPVRDGTTLTFALDDEITKMPVCETTTWISRYHDGGLEVHPSGTGGVEVGETVHLNSEHGKRYYHRSAFWLRKHLAPTEREPLSPDLVRFKDILQRQRVEAAAEQGISEAQAAAQSLPPTIQTFLERLRPYAASEEDAPIDTAELFRSWKDEYDAQSLLKELELHGIVQEGPDNQAVLSTLGRETLHYLGRE